jgi:hypothetical protein
MSISQLITSNITDFSWIALGDVDLHFSVVAVRKANVAEEETARDV